MKIPTDEIITTKRCRLRYPTRADFPHIWSASRVPGFNDGMMWDPPSTREELEVPLKNSQESWEKGTAFSWTAETKGKGEFIGRIAIRTTDHPQEWSLGYWTHPTLQKRGYATELAAAVLDFGFTRLCATRIIAEHATWNDASGKVLRRVGMTTTGVNPKGFKKKGSWVEEYMYEILPP